eukprot:4894521-Amphidinium_carterae.1
MATVSLPKALPAAIYAVIAILNLIINPLRALHAVIPADLKILYERRDDAAMQFSIYLPREDAVLQSFMSELYLQTLNATKILQCEEMTSISNRAETLTLFRNNGV